MKHALILATRNPFFESSGRAAVLKTWIHVLSRNEFHIDMIVFGANRVASAALHTPENVRVFNISTTLRGDAWRALKGFVLKKKSLNSSMWHDKSIIGKVEKIIAGRDYTFTVADMMRTAGIADGLGIPYHLDLDDLLSKRYLDVTSHEGILGTRGNHLPFSLKDALERLLKCTLKRESLLLKNEEARSVRLAKSTSLVSVDEMKFLATQLTEVETLFNFPMMIDTPHQASSYQAIDSREEALVFMGALDYKPNVAAINFINEHILSVRKDLNISVIGKGGDGIEGLRNPQFKRLGYVKNQYDVLASHKIFLAPIYEGTGIKTKVLEACAAGCLVIGSKKAFEGTGLINKRHVLVVDSASQYIPLVQDVLLNTKKYRNIAINGADHVMQKFSAHQAELRFTEIAKLH